MVESPAARLRNLANQLVGAAEELEAGAPVGQSDLVRAAALMRALDPRATIRLRHDGRQWEAGAAVSHDWLMPRLGHGKGPTVEAAVAGMLADLVRTAERRIAEDRQAADDDELQAEADTLEGLVAQ